MGAAMKIKCKHCNVKGIELFSKLKIRRNRNIECSECGTKYNYPWGYGILFNMIAAALGSILLYLFFIVGFPYSIILWFLIGSAFIVSAMLLMPLKEVKQ